MDSSEFRFKAGEEEMFEFPIRVTIVAGEKQYEIVNPHNNSVTPTEEEKTNAISKANEYIQAKECDEGYIAGFLIKNQNNEYKGLQFAGSSGRA